MNSSRPSTITHRLIQVVFCRAMLLLLFFSHGYACAETRIHVLSVADTTSRQFSGGRRDAVALACEHDQNAFYWCFSQNIPQDQLVFKELNGRNVTVSKILRALAQDFRVDNDDTLVFFYTGHGATDARTRDLALTLTNRENLSRQRVLTTMKRQGARLNVVITDTCATVMPIFPPKARQMDGAAPSKRIFLTPAFRSLFVEPRGTCIVSGTATGEEGLVSMMGPVSFFTTRFCAYLGNNSHADLTWSSVIPAVREAVIRDIQNEFPGKRQTATLVQAPGSGVPWNRPSGVELEWVNESSGSVVVRGLIVVEVDGRSPFAGVLQAGDIVTSVNGQSLGTDPSDFHSAVSRAVGSAIVGVITPRGSRVNRRATLR